MMNLTQFYLFKIAEEASEVAQIALKAAQFGLTEKHPDLTENNAQRIRAELIDLLAMVEQLNNFSEGQFFFDLDRPDWDAIIRKHAKVERYLAYSQSLGMVEGGPVA